MNQTLISFQLTISDKVKIEIHDIEGRLIKNWGGKNLSLGTNELLWDATNNLGNKVIPGFYFVSIISDKKQYIYQSNEKHH